MKFVKRITALFLAMVMVMAMGITAFAAENKITVASGDTHTYEVYQIFKGTLSDNKLSDVTAGANFNSDNNAGAEGADLDVADAVKAIEGISSDATDATKLATISKFVTLSNPYKTITGEADQAVSETVDAGYYLIKDKDKSITGDDAYTTYIVWVAGEQTITRKAEKPQFDKQVQDETGDKEDGADSEGWGESADHAINESFQFKLTATLTGDKDYDAYKSYKVVFHDVMSTGITFENIVSVKVGNQVLTENASSNGYTKDFTAWSDGNIVGDGTKAWTLTIDDLKKVTGVNLSEGTTTVEVIYKAYLNESAQRFTVSATSTTNKNTGYLTYSNNPNVGGEGSEGQTPEDYVWLFTYDVANTKYAGPESTKTALNGAEFKLYKENKTDEVALKWDETLKAYRPVKGDETGEALVSGKKDTQGTTSGEFLIAGLDTGTYYLKETKTPAGYNTMDDFKVVISATHKEVTDGKSASMTLDQTSTTSNTLINMPGSTLPSTGGMGTTILYVAGIAMIVVAGVVVIARKRNA